MKYRRITNRNHSTCFQQTFHQFRETITGGQGEIPQEIRNADGMRSSVSLPRQARDRRFFAKTGSVQALLCQDRLETGVSAPRAPGCPSSTPARKGKTATCQNTNQESADKLRKLNKIECSSLSRRHREQERGNVLVSHSGPVAGVGRIACYYIATKEFSG